MTEVHGSVVRSALHDDNQDAFKGASGSVQRSVHRSSLQDVREDASYDARRLKQRSACQDARADASQDARRLIHRDARQDARADASHGARHLTHQDARQDASQDARRLTHRDARQDARQDALEECLSPKRQDISQDIKVSKITRKQRLVTSNSSSTRGTLLRTGPQGLLSLRSLKDTDNRERDSSSDLCPTDDDEPTASAASDYKTLTNLLKNLFPDNFQAPVPCSPPSQLASSKSMIKDLSVNLQEKATRDLLTQSSRRPTPQASTSNRTSPKKKFKALSWSTFL
ncbi:cylicin-1-like [Macrobrachium nipponense]|uniref:cylicin-1-like n=1 Tax=Macrobrachium nipponense TaxID=159736 RepID=UPI0030C7DD2B